MLAIIAVPMILILGLAVDTAMVINQQNKLYMAVNSAANAGATSGNGISSTMTTIAQNVFTANTANATATISAPSITVNTTNSTITVSANVTVPTFFMRVGGISTGTYTSTYTAKYATSLKEVAIIYEVSARFLSNNFHANICTAILNFVNSLPSTVMVSITPIATEILFDPTTTVPSALYGNLSQTANDESAYPGFFPLATNYSWSSANYNTVSNPFYATGYYASYPTDPGVLMSHAQPYQCSGNYASCSPIVWPVICPLSRKTSCSQVYSYASNTAYPILPLTLNRTLIATYLTGLKAFAASSDGMFPSLISWGWRTIDPNWKNFWLVNSSTTSTARTSGQYPMPYGTKTKSVIIILNDVQYWDQYSSQINNLYNNTCGDATTVVNGLNHWWVTSYGMIPVPLDNLSAVNDITCENLWYQTLDVGLGLNLTATDNYSSTVSTNTYTSKVLTAVSAKFFRICTNLKSQSMVNVYLMSNANTGTLGACCNSSSNAYTITNSVSNITAALTAIQTKIVASP